MTTRAPDRRPKHAAGDGDVPAWWTSLDRRRLVIALGSTFVAVPVVVLDNLPQHRGAEAQAAEAPAEPASTRTSTTALAEPSTTVVTVTLRAAEGASPSTTTTTVASTTTTTAPTAPTATTARPTTTTTAPPPPPTLPPNTETGKATWYAYRDGECAHKTLPRGTVVTITNMANGRTATCTVTDRGPYGGARIIDLDDDTFAQLAPLSAGIIDVTIRW